MRNRQKRKILKRCVAANYSNLSTLESKVVGREIESSIARALVKR